MIYVLGRAQVPFSNILLGVKNPVGFPDELEAVGMFLPPVRIEQRSYQKQPSDEREHMKPGF